MVREKENEKKIMRHRQVLSAILTLGLFLTSFALSALAQSPGSTQPVEKSPVLHMDKPLRFLNAHDLPADIPPGIYQVTAKSADTLQLISTSTGEAKNLHAITMTHTESLTVPYPLLIEEAEAQGRIHLVLLLPDGRGLDAEGRREEIQTRGATDLTRSVFTPARRYSGVVLQQGRVTTDTDWKEQEAVSSSAVSKHQADVGTSYGRVVLEQGRIKLNSDARHSLSRNCRFCTRKP
jgi:hypothetical protein